jgi:hypothetical protein
MARETNTREGLYTNIVKDRKNLRISNRHAFLGGVLVRKGFEVHNKIISLSPHGLILKHSRAKPGNDTITTGMAKQICALQYHDVMHKTACVHDVLETYNA